MSIPFSVAATLTRGEIEEENYSELDDADIIRLVAVTDLRADAGFTAAFPGKQGAEVTVHLRGGRTIRHALPDVIAATPCRYSCALPRRRNQSPRRGPRAPARATHRRLRAARQCRLHRSAVSSEHARTGFTIGITRNAKQYGGNMVDRETRLALPTRTIASKPALTPRGGGADGRLLSGARRRPFDRRLYGLMCVGLGLIFGVMRVINFAQGDFLMLGMYSAFYLVDAARRLGAVRHLRSGRSSARPAGRPGAVRLRLFRASAPDLARHRDARSRRRRRRPLRAAHPDARRRADPAERRADPVRLDAESRSARRCRRSAWEFGPLLRTITRLRQQGAQHRRDRLARGHRVCFRCSSARLGSASRCGRPPTIRSRDLHGHRRRPRASHRLRRSAPASPRSPAAWSRPTIRSSPTSASSS